MENNRNNQQSAFENNLQEMIINIINNNLQHILPSQQQRQQQHQQAREEESYREYNDASSSNERYDVRELLNTLLYNLNTSFRDYNTNMSSYLTILNNIITLLNSQENTFIGDNNRRQTRNNYQNTNASFRNNNTRPITRPNNISNQSGSSRRSNLSYRTNIAQPFRFNSNTYRYPNSPIMRNISLPLNIDINNDNIYRNIFTQTFENVVVRPTEEQINNATEIITYTADADLMNHSCPISLEDFVIGNNIRRIIHCGHCFAEEAFQSWFNINVRCPVCRYDIRDFHIVPSTSEDTNENAPISPTNNTDSIQEENSSHPMNNTLEETVLNDIGESLGVDASLNILFNSLNNIMAGNSLNNIINSNSSDLLNVLNDSLYNSGDPSHNLLFQLHIPLSNNSQYDASYNLARSFN